MQKQNCEFFNISLKKMYNISLKKMYNISLKKIKTLVRTNTHYNISWLWRVSQTYDKQQLPLHANVFYT